MTDKLVEKIRKENYLLKIFELTKNITYINEAKRIVEFVIDIYRNIEPSHFDGKILVFHDFSNNINLVQDQKVEFYDKGILNNNSTSLIFQNRSSDELPLIWMNIGNAVIKSLLLKKDNFIAYVYDGEKEYFIVNKHKISIVNKFSCPSIFALQYHNLNEALLDYKNERIKNVSCEHFKKCWADKKWIYLKNKPENDMQLSLSEYLKTRIRGVKTTVREYNLGASKPVDIRVFWSEANRAALIELKWLGKSLKKDESLGTAYSNGRSNDGAKQIKEYIDLENGDTPTIITKGYLVVIDGRRRNINSNKVTFVSRTDGFHYSAKELEIDADKKYWKTHPNIEKPVRMFVEPICEM